MLTVRKLKSSPFSLFLVPLSIGYWLSVIGCQCVNAQIMLTVRKLKSSPFSLFLCQLVIGCKCPNNVDRSQAEIKSFFLAPCSFVNIWLSMNMQKAFTCRLKWLRYRGNHSGLFPVSRNIRRQRLCCRFSCICRPSSIFPACRCRT